MPSMMDVARLAEVSLTTVSHTLSGKRHVSPDVRQRVLDAMRQLEYTPRRAAQTLASGSSRMIAILVPDIGNSFFAELVKGAEHVASERGYNLILCNSGFSREREQLYLETFHGRSVDGILYAAGAPPTKRDLEELLGGTPCILVDEEVDGLAAGTVVSDNESGGRLAARHLLELGHTRAGILAASGNLISSARRVDGFSSEWEQATGTTPLLGRGLMTEAGGRHAIAEVLDQDGATRITALFAVNDLMALGSQSSLRQLGYEIPRDISVVGFDDSAVSRLVTPSLTTVRQNVSQLGARAAAALISALSEGGTADCPHDVLPVELIVRKSTGRASSRQCHNEGCRPEH